MIVGNNIFTSLCAVLKLKQRMTKGALCKSSKYSKTKSLVIMNETKQEAYIHLGVYIYIHMNISPFHYNSLTSPRAN